LVDDRRVGGIAPSEAGLDPQLALVGSVVVQDPRLGVEQMACGRGLAAQQAVADCSPRKATFSSTLPAYGLSRITRLITRQR
jgi:hypothetical protein